MEQSNSSQETPLYPELQEQLLGDTQIPFPEQLFNLIHKGILQLTPDHPALHRQSLFFKQRPFPLQLFKAEQLALISIF